MSNSQRLRIGVAIVLATTAYYYLLMISIGYLLAVSWPTWWMGIFPSTLIGSRVWMFAMHTAAVLISAIPVALLVRLLVPGHAVAACLVAALSALVLVNLPLDRDAIALVWAYHPVLLIGDSLKVVLALPFLAWTLCASPLTRRWSGRSTSSLDIS